MKGRGCGFAGSTAEARAARPADAGAGLIGSNVSRAGDSVAMRPTAVEPAAAGLGLERPPLGLICPGCGYDLSGAASERCSECGRTISERDVYEFIERDRYTRGYARAWMVHVHVAVAAVVIMSAGAGLVAREPAFAVLAGALTACAFAAPPGLAWGIARLARPHLRPAYLTFWARSSWLLHAPWLVIPACALIAFIAAWIDSMFDTFALAFVVVVGFGAWGLGTLSCLLGWFELWHEARRQFGLSEHAPNLLYGFQALVTFCGAAGMGVAGGALAAEGAQYWFM